ncbi:MAG: ABC transporter substrate-binding protein [Synergistaceae bacterium]|nr:ABC transporter substrate-binding protein [Synergistaceae bacterium]
MGTNEAYYGKLSEMLDALNALQAGKIDVAVSFGTAAPLTFVTRGADFCIFGGYVSGGMPVYAKADFDYKGLESFVGKKIAVARMYTPDIVWRGAMMRAGYNPEKDCTIMEFKKPADVLEAVKSGKADVGIGTNSTYLQSLAAGLKTLTWTNDLDPMHVCCRPVGLNSWLNEKTDVVRAFLRAWIRAEAFLLDNQEECVKINEKYLKLDEEQSRVMLLETNQVFESDPKSNGVRYMWDLLGKLKYAETEGINVEDHLNVTLYKEALDELQKREPENKHYKEFAERFVKYNQ